jgi:hypothetical protein
MPQEKAVVTLRAPPLSIVGHWLLLVGVTLLVTSGGGWLRLQGAKPLT